jgi:hypothetical protein
VRKSPCGTKRTSRPCSSTRFYAVSIDPDLAVAREPIVAKDRWVEANERLIDEIGAAQWLRRLLAVLEGNYPTNPNDSDTEL